MISTTQATRQTRAEPPAPPPGSPSKTTGRTPTEESLAMKHPPQQAMAPALTTRENHTGTNLDSLTIEQATTLLKNPEYAAQAFHLARGPNIQCPKCSHRSDTHQIVNKPGAYRCSNCKSLFSIKTNTAMVGPSIKLTTWALASYLILKDPDRYHGSTLASSLSISPTPAGRIEQTIRDLIKGPTTTIQLMAKLAALKTFTPNPKTKFIKRHTDPQASPPRPYWEIPGEKPSPSRTEMNSSNKCPHCGATGTINDNIGVRCIMCCKPPATTVIPQDNTPVARRRRDTPNKHHPQN